MKVVVYIEVGHASKVLDQKTREGCTHEWELFIKGSNGGKLEIFVEKIVFYLHKSFTMPKRVYKDPPYIVKEQGYEPFIVEIDIYFRTQSQKKTRLQYNLYLQPMDGKPISNIRKEKLIFPEPTDDFKRKLLLAGGVEESSNSESLSRSSMKSKSKSQESLATKKPKHELNKEFKQRPEYAVTDTFSELFGKVIKIGSEQKLREAKPKKVQVKSKEKEKPEKSIDKLHVESKKKEKKSHNNSKEEIDSKSSNKEKHKSEHKEKKEHGKISKKEHSKKATDYHHSPVKSKGDESREKSKSKHEGKEKILKVKDKKEGSKTPKESSFNSREDLSKGAHKEKSKDNKNRDSSEGKFTEVSSPVISAISSPKTKEKLLKPKKIVSPVPSCSPSASTNSSAPPSRSSSPSSHSSHSASEGSPSVSEHSVSSSLKSQTGSVSKSSSRSASASSSEAHSPSHSRSRSASEAHSPSHSRSRSASSNSSTNSSKSVEKEEPLPAETPRARNRPVASARPKKVPEEMTGINRFNPLQKLMGTVDSESSSSDGEEKVHKRAVQQEPEVISLDCGKKKPSIAGSPTKETSKKIKNKKEETIYTPEYMIKNKKEETIYTPEYIKELCKLYEKISSLSDKKKVQEVVDIVGENSSYNLTPDFEFDLCALDLKTVKKLQKCLH